METAAAAIAVLPFANLSGGSEPDLFARGFVEDVATELSRFPTLEVIHPRSSLRLDRTELRADYLLEGSVRRRREALRVAVALVEAAGGRQVWGERYEMPADRIPEVTDEIAAAVAGALALRIDGARLARARRKPLASLEAYDCWLRGMEHLRRGSVEDDDVARTFFERALALDPTYARGWAGISLSHFNEWSCQAWELWDRNEMLAYEAARRAAELDDGDAVVHVVLAHILLYRRQFEEAARHLDRALALNPNDADVLVHCGFMRTFLGDAASGAELTGKALRLNPLHDEGCLAFAALPRFVLGRWSETIDVCERAPRATVDLPAYLAAACAYAGRDEDAARYLRMYLEDFREKITFGREPEPGEPLRWLLHVNPFRRAQDADLVVEGLRRAGLAPDPDEGRVAAECPPADAPGAVFRREGELWSLAYEGRRVQLSEVKGFLDLAELLAHPGREIHCLELAGRPAEGAPDVVLDGRARREVDERIRGLQAELDAAEEARDPGRAERARTELDALVEELSRSLGLGGRARRLGSPAERARTAVTWRIRSAIRKVEAAHPRLGRHLANAVRTGTYCSYAPEVAVDWTL